MLDINWNPGITLETVERAVIEKAYRFFQGNKTATARSLGIAIRTLEGKLEKYGQDDAAEADNAERRRAESERQLARARGTGSGAFDGSTQMVAEPSARADAGPHVEPAQDDSSQRDVPVSVGQKVQSVPSIEAAGNRSGKRR